MATMGSFMLCLRKQRIESARVSLLTEMGFETLKPFERRQRQIRFYADKPTTVKDGLGWVG